MADQETLLVAVQSGNYDGAYIPKRGMKDGTSVVADGHGRYVEASLRGRLFSVYSNYVTVTATTDISPLPATTGRVGIGVYNPATSTVNASIQRILINHRSGTPGTAGEMWLDKFLNATLAMGGATSPTGIPLCAGSGVISQAYGLAAAVPAQAAIGTKLLMLPLPFVGALASVDPLIYDLDLGGMITLSPGYGIGLTVTHVGTNHIYSAQIIWEEIPIV